MKKEREVQLIDVVSYQFDKDRIFANNPVVMQGMGLAPLVIVATTLQNAVMLAVAVLLLLTPTRVLAGLFFGRVKNKLIRVIGYTSVAALLYIGVYYVLNILFGVSMLNLGIYLPMLIMEPLVIYRYARVPEPFYKAMIKGIKMTLGYTIVLLIIGSLREILAVGTIYGFPVAKVTALPIASTPAGGFILLGVLCAVWRTLANNRRKKAMMKARLER